MESLFVGCAVRAALIAVATAIVLRTIGIKPAAARHTAWTSVMLTMLLLPIWTAWGPKAPIRLLPPVEWRGSIGTPAQNVPPDSVRLTEMRQVETSGPHPPSQNWTWQRLLLIVYGFGAFGLLAPGWQSERPGPIVSGAGRMSGTAKALVPSALVPSQWDGFIRR